MRLSILLALLSLTALSCGGSSDPAALSSEASRALGRGDFAAARADFDRALDAIGADHAHPEYLRAKMGAVESRTKEAPDEAVSQFLALAKELPAQVGPADYQRIGSRLGSAGHFDQAIALVKAGKDAHPDAAALDKLVQSLGDQAAQTGSSEALKALEGLGYVGK